MHDPLRISICLVPKDRIKVLHPLAFRKQFRLFNLWGTNTSYVAVVLFIPEVINIHEPEVYRPMNNPIVSWAKSQISFFESLIREGIHWKKKQFLFAVVVKKNKCPEM